MEIQRNGGRLRGGRSWRAHGVFLGLFLAGLTGLAEGGDSPSPGAPSADEGAAASGGETPESANPEVVTTRHSLVINGEKIEYTARAGTLVLKDREGEPTAEIFFVAYTRDGQETESRPLTFSFNGGPGSSSVWMHMGLLGPRRVKLDPQGFALPPPHQRVDNPYSLLDVTDLVFVDPVSTGYSRPVDFDKEKQFHGLEEDVVSVGDFIRRYITDFARWSSPRFLIGESYGTTRAAALAKHLQERYGLYLNGIMLVSAVLDFATLRYHEGNDLPYVLFLPSLAATARYHGRLEEPMQSRTLQSLLDEVEAFATGPYQEALFAGDSLPAEQARSVAASLSRYTGIPAEEWERYRLRLDAFAFFRKLLEDKRMRVGRFDSRYTGPASQPWETDGTDPSYAQIYGAYSSAFNDYVRRELGFESEMPYEVLTNVRPWNYGEAFSARYVNVGKRLRDALVLNPFMGIQVCAGYYDLATPYFASEYTFNRLFLHEELRDNIRFTYYRAGHMMYTVEAELSRQKAALADFIRRQAFGAHTEN